MTGRQIETLPRKPHRYRPPGARPRGDRRGAVLVLVMAAIVLLAATVTLVTRRAILSRRATDSAAAVAQAESVWVTAAEVVRHSGAKSDLHFSLPPRGNQPRAAIAQVRERDQEMWEIEVRIEEEGRVVARRRGMISVPQSNIPSAPEGEGESQ